MFFFSVNADKAVRKFKKGDRTRPMWSPREEEILIATLVNWLCWDGNPTMGFGWVISQNMMIASVKNFPHVMYKLTSWKTIYTSLRNILDWTGVGFHSNGDYKIDIDDEQWEYVV